MSSNDKNKHLQELGGSNYEIADGQPDIRGWNVRDSSGRKLGEVDELIFDVQARKVRYILLDMDDNECNLKEREVLVPIGLAELHEKDDDVILRNVSIEQLAALPEYGDDDLDANVEATIHNIFSSTGALNETPLTSSDTNNDFYSHEYFNNNLYRNRSVTNTADDYIRMRQEPSFLESEGSTRREIDDDVDGMREQSIEMEERDAIPVTNSTTIRAGNDIDERDITNENTPPHTNTDIQQDERNNEDRRNRPSGL